MCTIKLTQTQIKNKKETVTQRLSAANGPFGLPLLCHIQLHLALHWLHDSPHKDIHYSRPRLGYPAGLDRPTVLLGGELTTASSKGTSYIHP